MRLIIIVIILHICASLIPFVQNTSNHKNTQLSFQGWPSEFEGRSLTQIQLTEKERGFNQDFPGNIGRFTDGSRDIIIRYVERPSRKVHPSVDCLRGSGFEVKPQPISRDQSGQLWGCVLAQRNGKTYKVCERIYDQSGNSWYDVSSWFWSVILQNKPGPWWVITVAEQVQ